MSAEPQRMSEEQIAQVATVLVGVLERKGFDERNDPKLQPALLPAVRQWLAHWAELLVASPLSAAGPLASLIADFISEMGRYHSAELAKARAYMEMAAAGIESTIKARDEANDKLRAANATIERVRKLAHRIENDAMHTQWHSIGIGLALREALADEPSKEPPRG